MENFRICRNSSRGDNRAKAARDKVKWRVHGFIIVVAGLLMLFAPRAYGADSQPGWQSGWEKAQAGAKKEGQVNVYISGWGAVLDTGVFQKRFPEIKLVASKGVGAQMLQRILAERRAEKYIADVFIDGIPYPYPMLYKTKALDPVKPALILPEVTDESKWWQGKHRYPDPEKEYVFTFIGVPQIGSVYYNSNLVNPKEFRSFHDILNPKWKGKIEARDIREPGPGSAAMRFFYHHTDLGPKFMKQLFGEMDVTLFRDFRQGADWLANGKFALCFFCSGTDRARKQGLPVDGFKLMKEGAGVVSQYGSLALLNRAPHPNAAKVFINWFLSREGQSTLQRALAQAEDNAPDSLRIDIPKDDVKSDNRRVEGVKYLDLETPDRIEMEPVLKVFEEALAGSKKR